MNFKISKKVFYSSLQTVSRAISSNSPIPSLTGIKIDVLEDSIVLTGSDSDISIQKTLTADDEDINLVISETGSIVIEAKYILEIVRKIDADEIDLRIVDGSLTKISGNNAKFEINGVRAIDYPTLDFTKPSQQFELDADVLVKIVNQTAFATSDKETRPVLTGVNFKANGGKLECTATDSYRLAKKVIDLDSDSSFNITIPAKSLNELSKIIEKDSKVQICVSDKKAQFWVDQVLIQTRLIDGFYPETQRLIPVTFENELVVDSRDLLNAIDRASFIKNDGVSIIRLSAHPDRVVISTRSQEVGSSTEEILPEAFEGNGINISFSGRYVYEAIRVLNASTIKISFSGEMKPFIITNVDDSSILQLVLPVRTYN